MLSVWPQEVKNGSGRKGGKWKKRTMASKSNEKVSFMSGCVKERRREVKRRDNSGTKNEETKQNLGGGERERIVGGGGGERGERKETTREIEKNENECEGPRIERIISNKRK